jgi:hypothetical protein
LDGRRDGATTARVSLDKDESEIGVGVNLQIYNGSMRTVKTLLVYARTRHISSPNLHPSFLLPVSPR